MNDQPDKPKLTDQAIFEEELGAAKRNDEDGSIDEKTLIDAIADRLIIDAASEAQAKAKRLIERNRKPGSSDPEGQLCLPGFQPYTYEPNRIVLDDDHHLIEQAKATPKFKTAEARRARKNAEAAVRYSSRKATEAEMFTAWVIEGLKAGRKPKDLTYDTFVKETGLWNDGQAEPEESPDAET